MKRLIVVSVVLLLFSLLGGTSSATSLVSAPGIGAVSARGSETQPNIVLILTDDQRLDQMSHMPIVQQQITNQGTTFTNGYISNPLCCPSRASILTGRYSHGTQVWNNKPPYGGYDTFTSRGEDSSTIATWLQAAGYRTALIGKYLNGYVQADAGYVPPGWDEWDALTLGTTPDGEGAGGYVNYGMSINGVPKSYGTADYTDYSTDVLATYAKDFIASTPSTKPLFLYWAPRAPHEPAIPPQRYSTACQSLQKNRPPNWNESNVSDKPPYIQQLPSLTSDAATKLDKFYLKQCKSLLAVDDAVQTIMNALSDAGRLSNTFFLFMSDNGLANGEHRWNKKTVPYQESVNVPYITRYDQISAPATTNELVTNIDVAPTFADLGGATTPSFVEGKSIMPLLDGSAMSWRTDYLMEHAGNIDIVPPYCGVHTKRWVYVKYGKNKLQANGFEELYDLNADAYELTNLLQTDPGNPTVQSERDTLHSRMLQLCQPAPPGYTPT